MAASDRLAALARRLERPVSEGAPPLPVTILAAAVALAVIFPTVWLFVRAFGSGPVAAVELLVHPRTITVLTNSVVLVSIVTVGSVLIGVPLALITVQAGLPFRRFWTVAASLPLVVPSYIGAFAFVSAFGPHGELHGILSPLGLGPIPDIYGLEGASLVLVLFSYPYVFLTTRAALLSFDDSLVDAARSLGHGRWAAFRRVTLPQIRPAVAAGALLVALYALSDFGTPAIMHFDAFTRIIYVEYNIGRRDFAALLSIQLLVVATVILALESRVGGHDRTGYASRSARGAFRLGLGRWRYPAMAYAGLVASVSLVLPVAVLLRWLTRSGPGYAGGGFAFEWTFGWNSVYVSALAAVAAVLAAVPVAYGASRYRSRVTGLSERATYVGYAIPGIVLGLALVYFGAGYAPMLYQTLPLLVFAYVVRFLPQAVGSTRTSLLQVDPKLPEAARTLGRTPLEAFRSVTLPLIAPGIAAGAALVFLTTMKELPATLLLRPTGFETLVSFIWRVQEAGYYGQAAVPALALVIISGGSMLVLLAQEGRHGG